MKSLSLFLSLLSLSFSLSSSSLSLKLTAYRVPCPYSGPESQLSVGIGSTVVSGLAKESQPPLSGPKHPVQQSLWTQ
jgi:hypothetical protein